MALGTVTEKAGLTYSLTKLRPVDYFNFLLFYYFATHNELQAE